MHGRKRAEYKARLSDPKLSAALAQKAQQWNALSQELLQQRHYSPQEKTTTTPLVLLLTSKLLCVNPDPSHLWNHRRELLQKDFKVQTELELTRACLERNPKAYAAWFHRKWSVREYLSKKSSTDEEKAAMQLLLQQELQLCALLLQHDERNFHCWNYRRFVVSAMAFQQSSSVEGKKLLLLDGSWSCFKDDDSVEQIMGPQLATSSETVSKTTVIPFTIIQQEWDFCGEKIAQNFSNCSAFHYRSKLLPLMKRENLIQEELELVQNAIFTEPDDQTAWWYHRFVMEFASKQKDNYYYEALLQEQAELMRDLIDTENGQCKWGLLALVGLLMQLNQHEERNLCLERLQQLDPDRAKRYESMMKQEEK